MVGIRDHAVYCASKGGVNQLTRVLALEWSAFGINVNAVAPTFIYTPGTAERLDDPAYRQKVIERLPIGRVGNDHRCGRGSHLFGITGRSSGYREHVDGRWRLDGSIASSDNTFYELQR